MHIGLRLIDAATVKWLQEVASELGQTRHVLARELCEREN